MANFIQNWVLDGAVSGAVQNRQDPNDREASTMSRILGAVTGVDVDRAVDMNTVDTYLANNNLTRDEAGVGADVRSIGQARRQVKDYQKDEARRDRATARNEAYNDPTARDERRVRDMQFNAGRQDVANQMELTRMQMATNEKNRLADRADAREARADELQLQREAMDRADRRDERNRRRDSIAALTSGLAALGAAFAL